MPGSVKRAQQPIEVAAGLIFKAGRVLIARRQLGEHMGGMWEFPGGKREPGETFREALRSELHEELGIKVEVCEELWKFLHRYADRMVRLRFYHCNILAGDPSPLGCADLAWASRDELSRYNFAAADRRLLTRLRRRVRLWKGSTSSRLMRIGPMNRSAASVVSRCPPGQKRR